MPIAIGRRRIAGADGAVDLVSDLDDIHNSAMTTIDTAFDGVDAQVQANSSSIAAVSTDVDAIAASTGASRGSVKRSGWSVITTQETITGTGDNVLTTPDRVSGLVVPSGGGMLKIAFQADVRESNTNAVKVTIWVYSRTQSNPVADTTAAGGLFAAGAVGWGGVKTGPNWYAERVRSLGGLLFVSQVPNDVLFPALSLTELSAFILEGTYTVEVRYAASAGNGAARNRRLFARVTA